MNIIITFVILIFSAIIHEVSHGLMAEYLGDDTARDQGRITLNPIPHIDPFSSILLPLLLLSVHSPIIFGAAKPVPVNFNNLRNPKRGMALVSLAGPLSNFALAILFTIPIKLGLANSVAYPILIQAIILNIVLGTFNLIPIPPMDGSKIVASFLPNEWMHKILEWERYGFLLVMIFLYLGWLQIILVPVILEYWQVFHLSIPDLIRLFGQ
ncbi:MAG TPA: site-2 protease family protein [Candidatus Limnocylindria bacterium]|nr:site-2 protease family protein [Candidatus Limnocylindria bacterium]